MTKVNSTDIARLTGVSRSTVSKVINEYPNISDETRNRVLSAIKLAEYTPNISGRILAGKGTDTLAFFLFVRGHFSMDLLVNQMISATIEAAARQDYHILSYIIRYPIDDDTRREVKEVFTQYRADAGIIIGARNEEPLVDEIIKQGNIVSIFDRSLPAPDTRNPIVVNLQSEGMAYKSLEYLHSLGHRKVGILQGDMNRHSGVERRKGYLRGVLDFGLHCRTEWNLETDLSEESGYEAIRSLLESGIDLPTAFTIANDNLAFGVMRAFREAGIRIPDDMSIVASDDHPLSGYVHPGLTTFSYDVHEMADRLVDSAVCAVKDPLKYTPEHSLLSPTFVERASCRSL